MSNKDTITIGELAKRANTTVRTLQYYDKEGLIKPSFYSEGGRRLYAEKDLSTIHQIITLKSLGLSLKEIKGKLIKIQSRKDIVSVLEQQRSILEVQVSQLNKVIQSVGMLQEEVLQTKNVDWEKYSQMMHLISENNEYYWVLNFLDKDILRKIETVHDEEDISDFPVDWLKELLLKIVELQDKGISPISTEGQMIAAKWWESVNKYTKGDPKILMKLYKFYSSSTSWPGEFGVIQEETKDFLEKSITHFLTRMGIDLPSNVREEKL